MVVGLVLLRDLHRVVDDKDIAWAIGKGLGGWKGQFAVGQWVGRCKRGQSEGRKQVRYALHSVGSGMGILVGSGAVLRRGLVVKGEWGHRQAELA